MPVRPQKFRTNNSMTILKTAHIHVNPTHTNKIYLCTIFFAGEDKQDYGIGPQLPATHSEKSGPLE